MSKKSPTDTPIGSIVNFETGPTRKAFTGAEVVGHDGQFIVVRDADTGRTRKIRPGALRS